jgi:hypothetical protein
VAHVRRASTARRSRRTCCLIAGGYGRNARINGNIKSSSIKNAIKPKQSQPIPTSTKPTARTGEWGEYRIFSPHASHPAEKATH